MVKELTLNSVKKVMKQSREDSSVFIVEVDFFDPPIYSVTYVFTLEPSHMFAPYA